MKCLNCPNETKNPKFCTRSCAASYNNKISPKRHLENKCLICETPISASRTYCKEHYNYRNLKHSNDTIKDIISPSYRRSIRARARNVLKNSNVTACENCGYDKHIQACHKKPVSEFPPNTPISVVNARENLYFFCPNCHWEYDNGLLGG